MWTKHVDKNSNLKSCYFRNSYLNHTKHLKFMILGKTNPDQWDITGISDADYAEDRKSSHSTTSFGIFLGKSLISWHSKKQNCVSESTTESEYIALSKCGKKVAVIKHLLDFLEIPVKVNLLCDKLSTIASIKKRGVPPKLKHIRVKYHAIKAYTDSDYDLIYIPTDQNVADIYTKQLCRPKFATFRDAQRLILRRRIQIQVGVLKYIMNIVFGPSGIIYSKINLTILRQRYNVIENKYPFRNLSISLN